MKTVTCKKTNENFIRKADVSVMVLVDSLGILVKRNGKWSKNKSPNSLKRQITFTEYNEKLFGFLFVTKKVEYTR